MKPRHLIDINHTEEMLLVVPMQFKEKRREDFSLDYIDPRDKKTSQNGISILLLKRKRNVIFQSCYV